MEAGCRLGVVWVFTNAYVDELRWWKWQKKVWRTRGIVVTDIWLYSYIRTVTEIRPVSIITRQFDPVAIETYHT